MGQVIDKEIEIEAMKPSRSYVVDVGVAPTIHDYLVPRVPFLSEAAQVGVADQRPVALAAQEKRRSTLGLR